MRFLYTVFLIASAVLTSAQPVLVPFVSGDKFGISDTNGKMIVAPIYEEISWRGNQWFEGHRKVGIHDTVEVAVNDFEIRNDTIMLSSVFNGGKRILADQPYDEYKFVNDACIVGRVTHRRASLTKAQWIRWKHKSRFESLFSRTGKDLYPDGFKRLKFVDSAGNSTNRKGHSKYILFNATTFQDQYGLFVFDADKQIISEWLIENQKDIYVRSASPRSHVATIDCQDQDGNKQRKIVQFYNGRYNLFNAEKAPVQEENLVQMREVTMSESVDVVTAEEGNIVTKEYGGNYVPEFISYYYQVKDSVYIVDSISRSRKLKLPDRAKAIFKINNKLAQYQPVIYRLNGKFGFIAAGKVQEPLYDSLIYYGALEYIAFQNIEGAIKAGVLNSQLKVVIPFEYDSIHAGVQYLQVISIPGSRKNESRIQKNEEDERYREYSHPYERQASDLFTVYKNGKAGLIDHKKEVLVPLVYDMIVRNGLSFEQPREGEYFITRNNGKYGVLKLVYDRVLKKVIPEEWVKTQFDFIPFSMLTNYYGVKGYSLYALYTDKFQFKGYGDAKGKLYYKE